MKLRSKYLYPLAAAVFLIICALIFIQFMEYHHAKIMNGSGIEFDDPVLQLFPRVDVSIYIFIITYGSVVFFTITHLRDPLKLAQLMFGYGVLLLLRMISMTAVPLNEPSGLVTLEDPFLNELIYPGRITTDLFFSGHIGIVFLIAFLSRHRNYFIGAGTILAILLLFQHIHFSIDILFAIPAAYFIALISRRVIPVSS